MKAISILDRKHMFYNGWFPIIHNNQVCSFRSDRADSLNTDTIKVISEELKDAYNRYNNADADKIKDCISEIVRLEDKLDYACKQAKKINQQDNDC